MPVVKSKKAKAQEIQELASEILVASEAAVVIADGLGDVRARRFQDMKGYNGWSDKDVFIVLTYLAPEVYARLNALGLWLGLEDTKVLLRSAAVTSGGLNTGFRKKPGTRKP